MKIAVIYGSDKNDIIHKNVSLLLDSLKEKMNVSVKEFFISRDLPIDTCYTHYSFLCDILNDSEYAKATNEIVKHLNKANLIIIAPSLECLKANLSLKYFMHYLAYKWMPHRPNTLMRNKMAVVISNNLHGNFNLTNYLTKKLLCWGIPKDCIFSKHFNFTALNNSNFNHSQTSNLISRLINQYNKSCTLITPNFSEKNFLKSINKIDLNSCEHSDCNCCLNSQSIQPSSNVYNINSMISSNSNNNITPLANSQNYNDCKSNSNVIPIKKKAKKTINRLFNLKKVVYSYIF